MEEFEIDDFEKLYALTSAELYSSEEVNDITFEDINFDRISNLAKFKIDHPELFDEKHREPGELDMYYYIIPVTVQQRVRSGNEEISIDKESYVLTDARGCALFIIMEDGVLVTSAELGEQLRVATQRYKAYIDKGIISEKDITDQFSLHNVNSAMELINEKGLTLDDVQKIVDERMKEHGIVLPENDSNKPQQEQGDERLEPGEELELNEGRTRSEANACGISQNMLEMLAQQYGCRVDQISFRRIDDYERLENDTGINARMYRGKTIALRINYGFQQRYFLVNSETGAQMKLQRGAIETGDIPELRDYFKFPLTRSNGKEDTSRPLAWDSVTGPSYITYLDVNGNVKEAEYINNGKADDMLRDERQRYIAEVAEADKALASAIDVYQKENTQENWLRVKDAMSKRIQVDKKYRVLENQKQNTIDTLEETLDETLDKYGRPKRQERTREDDEEDEWFTRGRH